MHFKIWFKQILNSNFNANVVAVASSAHAILQRAVVRILPSTECEKAFNLTVNSIELLCTSTTFSNFGRMDVGAGVIAWDWKTGIYKLLAVHTYRNNSTNEKLSPNIYVPQHAEWIQSVTKIIFC